MSYRGRGATGPRWRPPLGVAIYRAVGLFNVVLTFFRAATLLDQGGTAVLVGYATGGLAVLFFSCSWDSGRSGRGRGAPDCSS
jgi:hypothetical protein